MFNFSTFDFVKISYKLAQNKCNFLNWNKDNLFSSAFTKFGNIFICRRIRDKYEGEMAELEHSEKNINEKYNQIKV